MSPGISTLQEQLGVTVTQHGPAEFSWSLTTRSGSMGLGACVAQSRERFADFEQAMDEGFAALKDARLSRLP